MEFLVGLPSWLFALMIFFLRVADMSLDTIRVLFVVRGKKPSSGRSGSSSRSSLLLPSAPCSPS